VFAIDNALFLLALVVVLGVIFEYVNGFHDAANAIATVVATRVLSPAQAVLMAGSLNLVGALSGVAVAKTVGNGIVDAKDVKDGEFMTNVPPGYVIVCPGETSAEGVVRFDRPVPYLGLQITDVTFQFKDGKATWSAGTNEESIRGQYDRATGAKDRLGWLQIGLNPAASYGFLQDDLVAGAVEIGIGDNSEYGGKNHSNFGFQGRLTNATVRVGKKVVVDKGRLAA